MAPPLIRTVALALTAFSAAAALAEAPLAPIDRIKLTDGNLTCQQMQDEVRDMEHTVAEAQASQSSGQTKATAGAAVGVAAEVASRTGVFGAWGGLGGHLFGTVASKTAAGVVQEQGAQDAMQAQERQKQAQARKEHLSQLYLNKHCGEGASAAVPAPPEGGGAR